MIVHHIELVAIY